jgi:acyl carrier protein
MEEGAEPLFGSVSADAVTVGIEDGRTDHVADGEAEERGHDRPDGLSGSYVPPRGETEERVAAVWGEAFGFARVGVEDDFFDLGGDSLLATRITGRLREVLGVEVTPAHLFEAGTVAALAEVVDGLADDEQDVERAIAEALEDLESLSIEEPDE